jgi:hypothetical protein
MMAPPLPLAGAWPGRPTTTLELRAFERAVIRTADSLIHRELRTPGGAWIATPTERPDRLEREVAASSLVEVDEDVLCEGCWPRHGLLTPISGGAGR